MWNMKLDGWSGRSFCRTSVLTGPSDGIMIIRATEALRVRLHMLLMHGSDVNVHECLISSNTIASVSVVLPLWVSRHTQKTSSPVGFWVTLQLGWKAGV